MHKKVKYALLVFAMTAMSAQVMAAGEKNYEGINLAEEYEHFSPKTLELLKRFDCIDCHRETNRKLGPSYHDVAERYRGKKTYKYHGFGSKFGSKGSTVEMPLIPGLVKKVQLGGKGDWYKRTPMPINDEMEQYTAEFTQIIKEILSIPAY